ncbi:ankryin repeat protein [Purpureocillium lavendulum]|uniref:Ankryin repeat protein n=1 Tax=Purpureocillium lavendulum TaxID=1247861 RepID=A0AB34FJG8_9HYPO|nr:ankryin repeat protein [Purpureocillium lavendulum]
MSTTATASPVAANSTTELARQPVENFGLFELPQKDPHPAHSPPTPPNVRHVNIVAVHGLGGNWQSTWTAEDGAMWLRDRLPDILAEANIVARVQLFGYDSATVFTRSVADLQTAARTLLVRLRGSRKTQQQRAAPIIFVCHSLGGLVVKEALIQAWNRSSHNEDILEKARACLFLAVPHRGSGLADWADGPAKLLKILSMGFAGNSNFTSVLRSSSKDWVRLSENFIDRANRIYFRSFFETDRYGNQIIVNEGSAAMHIGTEQVIPLEGSNHQTICKFRADEDQRFSPVGDAILELADIVLPSAEGPIFVCSVEIQEQYLVPQCFAPDLRMEYLNPVPETSIRSFEFSNALVRDVTFWLPSAKAVFWLNGMAGTGKSTIARTAARDLAHNHRLGASFFFKRGETDRTSMSKVFPTLAADLVNNIPTIAPHVKDAIENCPGILRKSAHEQFDKLVWQPLSMIASDSSSPIPIVVLDAMDECEDEKDIELMFRLLSHAAKGQSARLKVFLTSRPELPIRLGFKGMEGEFQNLRLQEISQDVITHDITTFFHEELRRIRHEYNSTLREERQLPDVWPDPSDLMSLVHMAIPLFIFAATVCRFIGDRRLGSPDRQLAKVLQASVEGSQLAATYLPVLANMVDGKTVNQREESIRLFRMIVGGIIVFASPLAVPALARILDIPQQDIENKLDVLHSVLSVPETADTPVRLLHLSFRDFLVDPGQRTGHPFWVDEKETHQSMAADCLRVLECLRRDMCDIKAPGTHRSAVDKHKMDASIPQEVQYACLHWVYHLRHGGAHARYCDQVMTFLERHFLHWMESLSLMGRSRESVHLVGALQLLYKDDGPTQLSEFLIDAMRFVQRYSFAIENTPLQLYSSLLVFSPKRSKVRTTFTSGIPRWISPQPKVNDNWSQCLQTLEGHDKSVTSVAFSHDSALVASGSWDKTIRVWRTATGECIRTALREAIGLDRDSTPHHKLRLNNLGTHLLRRYERTSDIRDLQDSIHNLEKALELTAVHDPSRAALLNNLGMALEMRYDKFGDELHLKSATSKIRDALDSTPDCHPSRGIWLNNLSTKLWKEFELSGDTAVQDESISVAKKAVANTPDGYTGKARVHYELGKQLRARYEKSGDLDDLQAAITTFQKAWNATTAIPFDRVRAAACCLKLLGLQKKFDDAARLGAAVVDLLPTVNTRLLDRNDQQYVLSTFSGVAADTCAFLTENGKTSEALQYLERGRAVIHGQLIDDRSDMSELGNLHPDILSRYRRLVDRVNVPTRTSELPSAELDANRHRLEAIAELEDYIGQIRNKPGHKDFLKGITTKEMQACATGGSIIVVNVTDFRSDAFIITPRSIKCLPLHTLSASDARTWTRKFEVKPRLGKDWIPKNNQYSDYLMWLWTWPPKSLVDWNWSG